MKREDVKNKITGITEEQPNWLMQENGSDITREKFLSTLSLRRATTCYCSGSLICNFYPRSPCGERRAASRASSAWTAYFYPRSPCGERPGFTFCAQGAGSISIHALLAESDSFSSSYGSAPALFLSTLSLRRATWLRCWQLAARDISIHALLAESDIILIVLLTPPIKFLSTLSLRRATYNHLC